MKLVAQVEPSGGINPGHMVIGQENEGEAPVYLGFRFDPDYLPADIPQERWRDFFFTHAIPGMIFDETAYILHLTATLGRVYYSKRVACSVRIQTVIPPDDQWRPFARYSFNPDDFHSAELPCYNCVTWAVEVGNRVSPGFLISVRQGRIKWMVAQLGGPQPPEAGDGGQTDRQTGH